MKRGNDSTCKYIFKQVKILGGESQSSYILWELKSCNTFYEILGVSTEVTEY